MKITRLEKVQDQWQLEATCKGEIFEIGKHEQDTEVKAITYSFLEIEEKNNRVEIKIVYDI